MHWPTNVWCPLEYFCRKKTCLEAERSTQGAGLGMKSPSGILCFIPCLRALSWWLEQPCRALAEDALKIKWEGRRGEIPVPCGTGMRRWGKQMAALLDCSISFGVGICSYFQEKSLGDPWEQGCYRISSPVGCGTGLVSLTPSTQRALRAVQDLQGALDTNPKGCAAPQSWGLPAEPHSPLQQGRQGGLNAFSREQWFPGPSWLPVPVFLQNGFVSVVRENLLFLHSFLFQLL